MFHLIILRLGKFETPRCQVQGSRTQNPFQFEVLHVVGKDLVSWTTSAIKIVCQSIEANQKGNLRVPTCQGANSHHHPHYSSTLAPPYRPTTGRVAMPHLLQALRKSGAPAVVVPLRSRALRRFHATPVCSTDGVYRELTNMRVATPWVEALRKQREEKPDPVINTPPDRDLKPKKMSDSFHRVVRVTFHT